MYFTKSMHYLYKENYNMVGYKNKDWRKSMRVTIDFNNMTDKFLGERGFTEKQLYSYAHRAVSAFNYVKNNRGKD